MGRSLVLALFSMFSLGCGMQVGIGPAKVGMDHEPGRPMTLAHEPCAVEGSGALKRDHTGDGKDDTTHVMLEGREVCRSIDLDGDGKTDLFVYFDPNGGLRRQERHDPGGKVGEVAHFEGGKLRHRATDTDQDGKIDHWEHHAPSADGGTEVRHFRDLNGDGKIDQVWTWLPKKTCTTVHHDHDGDGAADKSHEVCQAPSK